MSLPAEVEKVWKEFWKPIMEASGESEMDQIKRELFDYYTALENVGKVYDHITGGRISKPNTLAAAVCSEADAHYGEVFGVDFGPEGA